MAKGSKDDEKQFATAGRLIELLDDLDASKELTLSGIERRFGIGNNAAREYIQFLGTVRSLEERTLGGRKRWTVAPREPTERAVVHVAALELALGALGWLEGTPYYDQLRALRREVAARVPVRDRDHVHRFVSAVRSRPFGQPSDRARFAHAARTVLQAIRDHHPCAMRYRRLDGEVLDYRIEPAVVVLQRDLVYVLARKQPGGELRIFELDGIEDIACVESESFVPPSSAENPEQLLDDSFGVYIDTKAPRAVRLAVRGEALIELNRRRLHASQGLGAQRPDGWTEVTFRVALTRPFRRWVLGWMPDVRVIEPLELRDELREAARAFAPDDPPAGGPDPREP